MAGSNNNRSVSTNEETKISTGLIQINTNIVYILKK